MIPEAVVKVDKTYFLGSKAMSWLDTCVYCRKPGDPVDMLVYETVGRGKDPDSEDSHAQSKIERRMLKCFHTVCNSDCFQALEKISNTDTTTSYRCPVCKTDTSKDFVDDSRFLARTVKILAGKAQSYKPADIPCKCGLLASNLSVCTKCRPIEFLCDKHASRHRQTEHARYTESFTEKYEWEGLWRILFPEAFNEIEIALKKYCPSEDESISQSRATKSALKAVPENEKDTEADERLVGAFAERAKSLMFIDAESSVTNAGDTKSQAKRDDIELTQPSVKESVPLLQKATSTTRRSARGIQSSTSVSNTRKQPRESLSSLKVKRVAMGPPNPDDPHMETLEKWGKYFNRLWFNSIGNSTYLEEQLSSAKRVKLFMFNEPRCLGNVEINAKQRLEKHVKELKEKIKEEEKFAQLCLRGACQVAICIKIIAHTKEASKLWVKNNLTKLFENCDFDQEHLDFYDLKLYNFPTCSLMKTTESMRWHFSLLGSQRQVTELEACRIPICTVRDYHPRIIPREIYCDFFDKKHGGYKIDTTNIGEQFTVVETAYKAGEIKHESYLYVTKESKMVNEVDIVPDCYRVSCSYPAICAVQIIDHAFAISHEKGIRLQLTDCLQNKFYDLESMGSFGKGLWWDENAGTLYALVVNSTKVIRWTWSGPSTFLTKVSEPLELQGARSFSSDDTLVVSGGNCFVCYYNQGNNTPVQAKDFLFCFDKKTGGQIDFEWKAEDEQPENRFINPFLTCANLPQPPKYGNDYDPQLLMICDGGEDLSKSHVKVLVIYKERCVDWFSVKLWNKFGEVMIKDIRIGEDGSLHYRQKSSKKGKEARKGIEAVELLLYDYKEPQK